MDILGERVGSRVRVSMDCKVWEKIMDDK